MLTMSPNGCKPQGAQLFTSSEFATGMPWGGVDAHMKIMHGKRSTPSVGRLTVLHVVGVVRSQGA